ncbi:MAG: hypothetical protein PVF58_21260 [Candidatus Methanofastidiosia archaeon]|jgi:hypothetical protein
MKTYIAHFKRLDVLQFLTVVSMIVLCPVFVRRDGYGIETTLTIFFALYLVFTNFFGRFRNLSRVVIKYTIMTLLAIIWTTSLYNISRFINIHEKFHSIYIYVISLIPGLILISYVAYYREWKNFYKAITYMPLEDHIKKEAKKRGEEIELELEKMRE